MKTRIFILTFFALFLAAIFITTSGLTSKELTAGTITCCLGSGCNVGPYTATLYDKNGISQGTCTLGGPGPNCCGLTGDFPTGKYHWTIDNGSVLCTGSVFTYTNGSDVTYTMTCGSNCVGY